MASKPTPDQIAKNAKADPNDTYLWHFRLQRLEAEPVWDSILYASGDLDLSVGGKSFELADEKPEKIDKTAKPKKQAPHADDQFDSHTNRRGIYMARGYIPSRDVMPNFLLAFDADDGRTPCPLRGQTVTAPQALFMMNNEMVEKESARLAARVLKQSSGNLSLAVNLAYREALGRKPTGTELDQALTYIKSDPARVKGFAWLLFNLDEFVYVR